VIKGYAAYVFSKVEDNILMDKNDPFLNESTISDIKFIGMTKSAKLQNIY
jgi:hypothetical protein